MVNSTGTYSSGSSTANSASSYAGYVSAASDVVNILSSDAQEEEKFYGTIDRVGLAVADTYTFGMASMAYGVLEQWGVIDALHKFDSKYNFVSKALIGLFDTDKWKTEGNRMRKLLEQGVEIPEALQGRIHQKRGLKKEELFDYSVPKDFVGYKPDGTWVNNKFTDSRDEKDLHPEDIWGYAVFFEKFGNDWLGKFTADQRRTICQAALDSGAVREHHGTIDIEWTPELEAVAQRLNSEKPQQ